MDSRPTGFTLVEMLASAVDSTPDGVAARFVQGAAVDAPTHTFAELYERALTAAGTLRDRGIQPGDRVVIVSPTEVGFYDAFFGTLCCGAVPVPVYPPLRLGKLEEWVARTATLVRCAGAKAIIADRRSRRLLGQVVARVAVELGVVALEELDKSAPLRGFVGPGPDDLALVQFSSGTTRTPAPVTLTHRQILANIDAILSQLPESAFAGGGCVSWLPLYHDMGLIGSLLTSMRVVQPITLIAPERFLARPVVWLEALSRYRGTVSAAPNFAYARCVEKITSAQIDDLDLSNWVVAMNGAEPIAVDTMRAFAHKFARAGLRPEALSPVYGLAEAALAVTFTPFDVPFHARHFDRDALARARASEQATGIELPSLGRALPGYEVAIRSDDRLDVPAGQVGQVWVRGPSLTDGYLDGASPTVDGWLDTGDRGFVLDDELYVCGRTSDVVVIRGRNHAAHDLERACDGVAGVRTGCVVAASEVGTGGERVHVFVEARERTDDLGARCRRRILELTNVDPDEVWVLDPGTLPRTSSGKLRRQETLTMHLRGELVPPAHVGPLLVAREVVKSALGYLGRSR